MRNVRATVLMGLAALLFVGSGGAAFATTYEFTYNFADTGAFAPPGDLIPLPDTVTGLFTANGSLNDLVVTGVLRALSLNGSPLGGTFTFFHYVATTPTPPPNDGTFVLWRRYRFCELVLKQLFISELDRCSISM